MPVPKPVPRFVRCPFPGGTLCALFHLTELFRTLHGWLGLLAAVLLLHPVVALAKRRPAPPGPGSARASVELPRRGLRWSSGLAAIFAVAAFTTGWLLYPGYREDTKPALLVKAPTLASLFEVKEHLAWYALTLALTGTALLWVGGPWARPHARTALLLAAVLGLVVAALGSSVGAFVVGSPSPVAGP